MRVGHRAERMHGIIDEAALTLGMLETKVERREVGRARLGEDLVVHKEDSCVHLAAGLEDTLELSQVMKNIVSEHVGENRLQNQYVD